MSAWTTGALSSPWGTKSALAPLGAPLPLGPCTDQGWSVRPSRPPPFAICDGVQAPRCYCWLADS
eukprot:14001600-Alexandrium_andersonii.AAC.1